MCYVQCAMHSLLQLPSTFDLLLSSEKEDQNLKLNKINNLRGRDVM